MEQQDISYRKSDYIETANNNKVSRQSVLCGSQNIVLGGKNLEFRKCIEFVVANLVFITLP